MKFIAALTLLVSSAALAAPDLSGVWTGTGMAHDAWDWKTACSSIVLDVRQSATEFTVQNLDENCGPLRSQWTETTMQIQGGELFSEGKSVGRLTENGLVIHVLVNPEDDLYLDFTLERVGDTLKLVDAYGKPGQPLVVTGELKR